MFPEIVRLGPWPVRSYGVFLALSFLGGLLLARHRASRFGLEPRVMLRLAVIALGATLIGSRLAYVLVNPGKFVEAPWRIVLPLDADGVIQMSGLVMNGGVVASVVALVFYARRRRLPVLATLDAIAPCLGLGILLTRIGCFLNGCCYGEPTHLAWGVTYPEGCAAADFQQSIEGGAQPLHPTQLYASLYGLGILITVLWVERRTRRPFPGLSLCLTLLLYGLCRFLVEAVRHYSDERGVFAGLTHNQWTSVGLVTASLVGLALFSRRRRAEPPPGRVEGAEPHSPAATVET